ncbi:hypothetical protein [Microvirga arsenatis]|uniref:Integrase n=1 Tax=Microvirga arsenatis TaxID=2692265 RepID=A0ABW9YXL6_9HYPH|nr:hypothetical protein [Microvirga arsenatis]NBJ13229.1 hypothetical protein [Microvirga arsenatis]NBJ25133.1 hypothetical protein [Microvirga arsenatis]
MAKGKSPYKRYGKTPHRYSELYQRWRSARLRGDDAEARALARQHEARFMGGAAHEVWDINLSRGDVQIMKEAA